MKTWECVEVCPHCDSENVIQWNTDEWGYTAKCQHCEEKMMLCDECMHEYNPETDMYEYTGYCDWCDDNGGVCYRDDTPVLLSTYGQYEEDGDVQHVRYFTVPKNWLWKYVKTNELETLDNFLSSYIWDTTIDVYEKALEDQVIQSEWED